MENDRTHELNYWKMLIAAEEALAAGDFAHGERLFHEASRRRDGSPGRVFFSEKITDGFKSLLKHAARNRETPPHAPGRWPRRTIEFRRRFLEQGEHVVRDGVRVAELRPEDDPVTNQPKLEAALFLVARSRIFQEEPSSAVPLIKGLFRTAGRTGRPFDFNLVRHDLPLTEEDRLWLAHKGGELFDVFIEHGRLNRGSPEAEEWARVVLQLVQPEYFGSTSRLAEERSWLEAVTADRLLGRAAESVELYRAYLGVGPVTGPRAEEARVRLLELLGNTDAGHFPVPRYGEALTVMAAGGPAPAGELASRLQAAQSRILHRRPSLGPAADSSLAWASLALGSAGGVTIIFWWDNEPRDMAYWRQGDGLEPIGEFLAPCEGRVVAFAEDVRSFVKSAWQEAPARWTVHDFMVAAMESRLPEDGLDRETVLGLCLAETGPWRGGWDPAAGHPELEPPRSSSLLEAWEEGPAAGALIAGLGWLAVRNRVVAGDPALRAGVGELARRGDAAARFLYEFINMDSHGGSGLDSSFEPWTLPLLWTRPDPFGWSATGPSSRREGSPAGDPGPRPDLGRNDLAIVSTGDPTAVLAAWGDGTRKWRVVLDRLDRLEALAQVAGGVIGPVTLIPPAGTVHSLSAALEFLESLLTDVRPDEDDLLPIFHWLRLVESHNGDLLDFRQVRPRTPGRFPLYDRYEAAVEMLAREEPQLDAEGQLDTWAGQFSQRVRKAGLVAGPVDHLAVTPERLDSLWGVFEGSDASWVFLDSAAIHWNLLRNGGPGIQEIHALLHTRGRRHLSLLTGSVWLRSELEGLLGEWLQVFGSPYCLSLTDGNPPSLLLADKGVQPEARRLAGEALAGQATWVQRAFAESGGGWVLLPAAGRSADFWASVSRAEVDLEIAAWNFLDPVGGEEPDDFRAGGLLAVPVLASLESEGVPAANSDTRADWVRADAEREIFFAWRRKICSLEMAACLAGPWDTVAVLDTRWWRLLLNSKVPAPGDEPAPPRSTGEIARLATEGIGRTLTLPGADPRGRQPVDGKIQASVNGWLMTRDSGDLAAADGAPTQGPQKVSTPGPGVHLLLGDETPVWRGMADRLVAAWERGQVEEWILLVADTMPAGAADLVTAAGMSGLSVWSAERREQVPAPVVWVEPEDFSDPDLEAFLAAYTPAVIMAGDVSEWKPGPEQEAQETALALRSILDCGAETVLLFSRGLDPSWVRFLSSACGAELLPGAGEQVSPSGPSVAPAGAGPCLDCGRARSAATVVRRLQALLPRLRALTSTQSGSEDDPQGESLPPGRQLLSLAWLGHLAGLAPDDVAEGVRLLRWAARLAGDSLSSAGSEHPDAARHGQGHALLIPRRFADLENSLDHLERNLGVMLPLWLGAGGAGSLNWIDMEYPPARIDASEVALLDCFLIWHGWNGESLGEGLPAAAVGLTYVCPRGLIHSTQRLVGCRGPSAEIVPELVQSLRVFRNRIADVMAGALETGDGFLVETGLTDLRDEESYFLGLGAALGFWRWIGPPCQGAVHLVDLLTVAESRTVRNRSHGWELVREEAAAGYPGSTRAGAGAVVRYGDAAESGRGRRGLRSLLAGGAEQKDDLDAVVARVADLALADEGPTFLVLKGVFGSGRHEALARGLLKCGAGGGEVPELTIYCPDQAVAAMVCRDFLRLGLTGPLDVRVPLASATQADEPAAGAFPADSSSSVVVICEAQRFASETRYRIAQTGRGRRLIMTVDPAAAREPWEHLFLTTPRADDVVELPGQRKAARKLWSETRKLVAPEFQGGGVRRRDKGILISDYAANLDQCLSRVVHEHEAGRLTAPLRITAPMPGDLEYLGSSIRDRGWLAVLETRLESLFLPGPRELLAAATDHLALCGLLDETFGSPPDAAGSEPQPDAPAGETEAPGNKDVDLMTGKLLGPEAGRAWLDWSGDQDPDPAITLGEFADLVAPTPWANTFMARPAARDRILRLLEQYGSEPLSALLTVPLWEAWWYGMMDDVAVRGPRYRRPLAVLTSASRPLGGAMAGAAYLCLGTEPLRQHYESLVRVTDSLLVLYQEKSPLPSESGE
ncbi:MAG: hypothetical protein ABFS42_08000 [Candidatus Krumholzibacteriota bacterium]